MITGQPFGDIIRHGPQGKGRFRRRQGVEGHMNPLMRPGHPEQIHHHLTIPIHPPGQGEIPHSALRLHPGIGHGPLLIRYLQAELAQGAGRALPIERFIAVPMGHNGQTIVGQSFQQLAFGASDTVQTAPLVKGLHMGRKNVGDHPHIRLRQSGQMGDLSWRAHAHLHHQPLTIGRHGQQRQRHSVMVVEVAPCGMGTIPTRQRRRHHLLDRCLSRRTGDGDHLGRHPAPPGRGQP